MNIGKMQISEELLLKFLDFDGGVIRTIRVNPDRPNIIDIYIEHPDMPEVEEGNVIPEVCPSYILTTDALGHKVSVRERP